MGAPLCRQHVLNVFGIRAGFDVDTSHIFPQGMLASITLTVDVVGVRRPEACTVCEVGLAFCSMVIATLLGVRPAPYLL